MKTTRRKRLAAETRARVDNLMEVGCTFIQAITMLRRDGAAMYVREGDPEPVSPEAAAGEQECMRRDNQLATWNATVPPGTPVMVRSVVGGPEVASRTRSAAWMICGHPSVLVEGKTGGYDLDFVRVVAEREMTA